VHVGFAPTFPFFRPRESEHVWESVRGLDGTNTRPDPNEARRTPWRFWCKVKIGLD
jgi:hypothetical protein